MNPLVLAGAVVLFFLLRKKPPTTPPPGQPGPGTKTPQGQLVILTNAVLANKLPCIDPAGKARVFDIKQMEKELNRLQGLLNDESQRAQPDEAYILKISQDYELLYRAMKSAAVIHLQKCQKYFDDFSKRPGSNTGQTSITTATNVRQAP